MPHESLLYICYMNIWFLSHKSLIYLCHVNLWYFSVTWISDLFMSHKSLTYLCHMNLWSIYAGWISDLLLSHESLIRCISVTQMSNLLYFSHMNIWSDLSKSRESLNWFISIQVTARRNKSRHSKKGKLWERNVRWDQIMHRNWGTVWNKGLKRHTHTKHTFVSRWHLVWSESASWVAVERHGFLFCLSFKRTIMLIYGRC